jgi:menaquinone-dependent protoporphyrinogen oxidase
MDNKFLLAYASTHGSTQEVAEVVAEVLRNNGIYVELQPIKTVRSLEDYSVVVLGAPLYMFHLHKDALHFLSKYQQALQNGLPCAIFAGGPIEKADAQELLEVRWQLDQELAKFPWFSPKSIEIVGGKLDPTSLRFPWNLIPALKQHPPVDKRDWAKIRTWANGLPELLGYLGKPSVLIKSGMGS